MKTTKKTLRNLIQELEQRADFQDRRIDGFVFREAIRKKEHAGMHQRLADLERQTVLLDRLVEQLAAAGTSPVPHKPHTGERA